MLSRPWAISIQKDAIVLCLEPLHALLLLQPVAETNLAAFQFPVLHSQPGACQVHIEIHAVDAGGRIVLDAKIDVLRDAKAERAVACKVDLTKLVLFDLEPLLKNFLRLLPTHRHMTCDFLVSADAEGS